MRPFSVPFRAAMVASTAALLLVSMLAAAGCGGPSARDALADAKAALGEARYDDALDAADAGLAGDPDAPTAWALELTRLEAFARSGRADETLAQLEKLADERPEQMPADQYAATADQLRAAGAGDAAIRTLDGGLARFPDDPELRAQIERVKQAAAPGSDELEMLRSLGYVE